MYVVNLLGDESEELKNFQETFKIEAAFPEILVLDKTVDNLTKFQSTNIKIYENGKGFFSTRFKSRFRISDSEFYATEFIMNCY